MSKTNLKGLDLAELQAFVESISESGFCTQQIFRWMYGSDASSFDETTSLSEVLRQKLSESRESGQLQLVTLQTSA